MPLTFRVLTLAPQTVLGRKDNVQPGQSLQRRIGLDSLLILDGYSISSLNVEHVGINNVKSPLGFTATLIYLDVNPAYPHPAQYYYKVVAAVKKGTNGTPVNVGLDSSILPQYYITDYNAYCKAAQVTIGNLTSTSFSLGADNQLTLSLQVPANYITCFNSTVALGERLSLQARVKSIAPWGEASILTDWKSAALTNGSYTLSFTFPVKNHQALLNKAGSLGDYQLELEVGHGSLASTTLRAQNLLVNYVDLGIVPAMGSPYWELLVADAMLSSVNANTGQTQFQASAGEKIRLILHNQSQFYPGDALTITLQDQNGLVLNLVGTLAVDSSATITIANTGTYILQSVGNAIAGYVPTSFALPILVRTVAKAVTSGSLACPPGKYCIASSTNYIKLDATGAALANQATGYAITPWDCVLDKTTNLMWEVATPAGSGGSRDANNTYTWYNSTGINDGGNAGVANGGFCAGSGCDTEKFVAAINAVGLCGFKDWRLPKRAALNSLVILSSKVQAVSKTYFPNAMIWHAYWSASPDPINSAKVWGMRLGYGDWNVMNKGLDIFGRIGGNYVKLVRGAK